ncbi:DUF402 domain-containing protein [Fredinandcohnia sp. SECRCQ15]|uniref:DUF402 domain-containing protein n=2 Tax=Fredinandcohnia quinoae TaxID=2918902 RepID=A0AAW5E3L1_9BACI|nr:DUF402 domain-containing protein [Fredinandcohnia sp. SECRCQ15]
MMKQKIKNIIERKIRYDSTTVDHHCRLLKEDSQKIVLLHKIEESFSMKVDERELTIQKGSYTIAYYWIDKPYNLYFWRDAKGNYLGSYFNIVRDTTVTDKMVSFEDLIIDILVLPNGENFILDENELPEPIEQFEDGYVLNALNLILEVIDSIIQNVKLETENLFKYDGIDKWLIES